MDTSSPPTLDRAFVRCVRCVMDTTDPDIVFDAQGICHHCHEHDRRVRTKVLSGDEGRRALAEIVATIKRDGRGRRYDCIIGVSGGVDSTYVAWLVKDLGLRPLAVHLDNGWNSELAVKNIENVLARLGIDLHTHVIDWQEFRDLQLAFLRASTPDSEIPSDHAIFSLLYQQAKRQRVRWVVSGINVRTETHLPQAWSQGHRDWRYIRSVHRRFGSVRLRSFPHRGLARDAWYRMTVKWLDALDYVDYVKRDAMALLQDKLGWRYYGGKHYESIYTRFYQGYILPRKFGYDKRKCHLSSLVCAGQMTRDEALAELAQETYPPELQREDLAYVCGKFGLSEAEFAAIMDLPRKRFEDYPSSRHSLAYRMMRGVYRTVKPRPA